MKHILLIILFLGLPGRAHAADLLDSCSVDLGRSSENVDVLRIGLQRDFGHWWQDNNISLAGFFELSLNYWQGGEDEIYGLGFSPVFRLTFFKSRKIRPHLEVGVGGSLISETSIEARNLASAFQFEDRIGFMIDAGDVSFHITYMHYSNAGIKPPNNGMDLFLVGVRYQL